MLQYVIAGLVLGGIYAISSAGLVVTYVSAGILNFAFGSLAYFVARFYYWLHIEQGWDILPAAAMAILVVAPLTGVLLYAILFRFVRLASSLLKVVVTIGLSVCIPPLSQIIFGTTAILRAPGLAPEPVKVYRVFDTPVTADQLIVYISVLLIVVVGALVLRYTEVGLSVRAMVDSEAMTSLSGTNPSRVSVGVWAVSSFMAGLAGVLAAPIIGLEPGDYTLLIAAAFAAVIAAKLRSLPIAVVVSLLMGITGSLVQYFMPSSSTLTAAVIPSIPFAFIVVFLVYHMVRSGRVSETEGVGGALDRAIRPQGGSKLAASADVGGLDPFPRINALYGPVIVFAIVASFPLLLAPFWGSLTGLAAALGICFLSYTLVTGEGGMIWLAQITFAGVGALTTAQLATVNGWPLLLAIVAGGLVASVLGLIIGFLTIRLGDLYVALVTLTFGILMERLVFTRDRFYQFGVGVSVDRPGFADGNRAFAWLTLAVFALLAIVVTNLRRSTTGLALNAVRWSEPASRTMGLSVLQMKLMVAGIASFVAGVGGGFLASYSGVALPDSYVTLLGTVWLAVVATFGVRSNISALLAGCAFTFSPVLFLTYLSPTWGHLPPVLFGLGAIFLARNPEGTVAMYARGILGFLSRFKKRPLATAGGGGGGPALAGVGPSADQMVEVSER